MDELDIAKDLYADPRPQSAWDQEKVLSWERNRVDYDEFLEAEGLPTYDGLVSPDLRTLDVGAWERTGGKGAILNLDGFQYTCDMHVHEIPSGDELLPQRHLFESIVFVVEGNGATRLESGSDEVTFEWQRGSLFCLPRNTRYTHSNLRDEPARLVAMTPLPLLYTLLKDDEAIWDIDGYDQLGLSEDFYSEVEEVSSQEDEKSVTRISWDANFIPDILSFDELADRPGMGGGLQTVYFPFERQNMRAKIGDFAPRQYPVGHWHLAAANLIALPGCEGSYSLVWEKDDIENTLTKIDWEPYRAFSPPNLWMHHHFNPSPSTSRYLVLYGPPQNSGLNVGPVKAANNRVPKEEQDPRIEQIWQHELEKYE